MATVLHFLLGLFLLLAGLGQSRSSISLSSNWTKEMVCPQVVEVQCVGKKLNDQSLQWLFDDKKIANYVYNKSDTFPYTLSDVPDGVQVVIMNATLRKRILSNPKFDINSILTTDTSRLNIQNVGCGPDDSSPKTLPVDFRCVDVSLQANTSLQGEICPGVVKFKCTSFNLKSLLWYFGNDWETSYTPTDSDQFPYDLCLHSGGNDQLADLCKGGGRLVINSAKRNDSSDGYDISSSLLINGTYINLKRYDDIQCGGEDVKALTLTNFTVSCNQILGFDLQLTGNNVSKNSEACDGLIEMQCVGDDLASFKWTYNDNMSLTDNYTYSSGEAFPRPLDSALPKVAVVVSSANTARDLAARFNFVSTLSAVAADLAASNVTSFECSSSSDGQWKQITVNCTRTSSGRCVRIEDVPDWIVDFCHLNAYLNCSENLNEADKMCIPIVGAAAALVGAVVLLILAICCSVCVTRYRRKDICLGDVETPLLERSKDDDERRERLKTKKDERRKRELNKEQEKRKKELLIQQETERGTADRITRQLFTSSFEPPKSLPDLDSNEEEEEEEKPLFDDWMQDD